MIRYLTERDIEQLLTMKDAVRCVEKRACRTYTSLVGPSSSLRAHAVSGSISL